MASFTTPCIVGYGTATVPAVGPGRQALAARIGPRPQDRCEQPALRHVQRREFRSAVAMMVSVGLCAPEVGKTEPSATNRLSSWW